MQTSKSPRENVNAQSGRFSQRIGSTVYTVNIYPKEGKSESLEDKVLRLIMRDLEFGENPKMALPTPGNNVKMAMPQADWLPGRSSV